MKFGYFKVSRKLIEDDIWLSEPFTKGQAWIDLIALARYKDGVLWLKGNAIDAKRGQIFMSEANLAERWKWSRGKVRRFISNLETIQYIVQEKSVITNCISILNYEKYQTDGTTNETTDGHLTDISRTSDGHLTVQERNKEKKDKEINKGKEELENSNSQKKIDDPFDLKIEVDENEPAQGGIEFFRQNVKTKIEKEDNHIWASTDNWLCRNIYMKLSELLKRNKKPVTDDSMFKNFERLWERARSNDFHAKNLTLRYFDKNFNVMTKIKPERKGETLTEKINKVDSWNW